MPLRASRVFVQEPLLPPSLRGLARLSRNLCWTWLEGGFDLFARVDPEAWAASGHNPVLLLQQVSRERWQELASDARFTVELGRILTAFNTYLEARPLPAGGISPASPIAYFSLEFGLSEGLPNYAGGLGILAGDHLKSASDLRLPLVAVGLFYREGYFQQEIDASGWQIEQYPELDPATLPLARVMRPNGDPLDVQVPLPAGDLYCAVWRLDVGRVPLYLLDSDLPRNPAEVRSLSHRLYSGDQAIRLQQEMMLGIGGVRALTALGIRPAVYHMNEGHSALLGIERTRALMEESGASFDDAREPVRASTVFTTHTAVEAGIDVFPVELALESLARSYSELGLTPSLFADLGRDPSGGDENTFSMAVLGLGFSSHRNGVSQLHGGVARRLWHAHWPVVPEEQVPIGAVSNGIHLATWVADPIARLLDAHAGSSWRHDPEADGAWAGVANIPPDALWAARNQLRRRLADRVRSAVVARSIRLGSGGRLPALDPGVLTIGFARRFAAYKRATMPFRDPERLASILNDPERPAQLVFAGKAHPRDEAGKHLIRELVQFSERPEFAGRVFVLERYDVELARALVQGCDVWLNTPLRPLEASGTSGMKAVANGGLHLSVRDGWWAEAYRPGLGWAIGNGRSFGDRAAEDTLGANSLYDLLEHEVVPLFYDRDERGLPLGWLGAVKSSIAAYSPRFNTHRMVREYLERSYRPAAEAWEDLTAENLSRASALTAWQRRLRVEWPRIRALAIEDTLPPAGGSQGAVTVSVTVACGGLSPDDLAVDLLFGPADEHGQFSAVGTARASAAERLENNAWRFRATFEPLAAGRSGYAVRITPSHCDLASPLDLGLVHWG